MLGQRKFPRHIYLSSIFAFSLVISMYFSDLLKIPLRQRDVQYFLNFLQGSKTKKGRIKALKPRKIPR